LKEKAEEIKDKVNKIRVTISDTGEGMTEEELSKMFQSFSRGMAGTKLYTQGAGLGLYVAHSFLFDRLSLSEEQDSEEK